MTVIDASDTQAQYALMARALAYIEHNRDHQPDLEEVAASVGLSPTHFQRVFSRWVGVSPKRYLQYLTLDQAKRLLHERFTVLDTAYETGLSGPSRLHDLFIRWEAMTPGDYALRGEGLTIGWAWADSPFGPALIMATEKGICGMAFAAEVGREPAMADLKGRWPRAAFVEDRERVGRLADAAFSGRGETPLALFGAPFQIKVWEALLSIPTGHVTTYSEIARRIGSPKAVRAVGSAVGRNPISWLIPCHRAIRRDGGLGGYHWGLPVKRAMLAWEAARADSAA